MIRSRCSPRRRSSVDVAVARSRAVVRRVVVRRSESSSFECDCVCDSNSIDARVTRSIDDDDDDEDTDEDTDEEWGLDEWGLDERTREIDRLGRDPERPTDQVTDPDRPTK